MRLAVYSEVIQTSSGSRGQYLVYNLVTYAQPKPRRWLALAYHHVWERLTWRALRYLERPAVARHGVRCRRQGGCDRDDEGYSLCSYIPWTNRQDLRCFDLMTHGRAEMSRSPLSRPEAVLHGWPE